MKVMSPKDFENIIYYQNDPSPLCFYDWLRFLIEKKQLRVTCFKLPKLGEKEREQIIERARTRRSRYHYKKVSPEICFALHKKGYDYNQIEFEQFFMGLKPDILARNESGSIAVEIGSLSNLFKVLQTANSKSLKEFWLYPQTDEFVYVFVAEKSKNKVWNWLVSKWKEVAEKERERDGGFRILTESGCCDYPECEVDYRKKPCSFEVHQARKDHELNLNTTSPKEEPRG